MKRCNSARMRQLINGVSLPAVSDSLLRARGPKWRKQPNLTPGCWGPIHVWLNEDDILTPQIPHTVYAIVFRVVCDGAPSSCRLHFKRPQALSAIMLLWQQALSAASVILTKRLVANHKRLQLIYI